MTCPTSRPRVKLTSTTLFSILLIAGAAPTNEPELLYKPSRVMTSSEPSMFPESWRKAPISASGEILPEQSWPRAREILSRALSKYPPALLQIELKATYVLADLGYQGIHASGTNSRTTVYIKVGDPARGFTDAYVEGTFHHEFSSILLRNHSAFLDTAAWEAANPSGFSYLGSGVDAVKQGKAHTSPSHALYEQGFLREYAQSSLENDFNVFADALFTPDPPNPTLWQIAAAHPRIKTKLDVILAFYQKVDPAFTESFFRKLAAKETTQPATLPALP